MTERKWTPGPWFVDETKGPTIGSSVRATIGIWSMARFNAALELDDDDIEPEDEKWLCGAWGVCAPEDFANAHLIAAAPDLYEALADAIEAWETHNESGDAMQGCWVQDARDAIAKAEGKAQ
jgi:Lon protease-like protein